jgi:hypothetical protein
MPSAMTGMHPQMLAESMHMGGRRYPAGAGGAGIPAGGMPPPAGLGGRGGHMMWYKDMQHMGSPRDAHEHPGFPEGYMGGGMVHSSGMLAEHPASHARLQLQVNYLLAENHNLRCENTPNISDTHIYYTHTHTHTHTHTSRTHHVYMCTYIQICMPEVSARIYMYTHTHKPTTHTIYTHIHVHTCINPL